MSRMDEQYTTSEIAGSAPALPLSAGQWLRQARERAGMDLGVLSALIKVPVRQLQALEADQHDQLMGTAFVRSLTVTICRHLNVEPQPALDLLPGNVTRLGPQKDSLGQADAAKLGGLFHGRGFAWGKWVALLLAVLVAGGVYGFLRQPAATSAPEVVPPAVMPAPSVTEPVAPTPTDASSANAAAPVTLPVTVNIPVPPAAAASDPKGQP